MSISCIKSVTMHNLHVIECVVSIMERFRTVCITNARSPPNAPVLGDNGSYSGLRIGPGDGLSSTASIRRGGSFCWFGPCALTLGVCGWYALQRLTV
jgi:hypothetical protein